MSNGNESAATMIGKAVIFAFMLGIFYLTVKHVSWPIFNYIVQGMREDFGVFALAVAWIAAIIPPILVEVPLGFVYNKLTGESK